MEGVSVTTGREDDGQDEGFLRLRWTEPRHDPFSVVMTKSPSDPSPFKSDLPAQT